MKLKLIRFAAEESGQDLTEYSLLIVFILLCVVGLVSGMHDQMAGILGVTDNNLAAATTAAS